MASKSSMISCPSGEYFDGLFSQRWKERGNFVKDQPPNRLSLPMTVMTGPITSPLLMESAIMASSLEHRNMCVAYRSMEAAVHIVFMALTTVVARGSFFEYPL